MASNSQSNNAPLKMAGDKKDEYDEEREYLGPSHDASPGTSKICIELRVDFHFTPPIYNVM